MQKSTWTAPTFEEIDLDGDGARDDVDDAQLLGRDTHVRLRSQQRHGVRSTLPMPEDQ